MTARPEQALQIQVVHALRWLVPDLVFFHPANGGKRDKREAALMKAMGVLAGASDLIFVLPEGRFGAIELKADKGRLSEEQEAFLARLEALGAPCGVARSLDEVLGLLRSWGVTVRGEAA
jgi:hypothetical protein